MLIYMSNKILSVLNQRILDNNNMIKAHEKNVKSVELKNGNVFIIYDDFSKIDLGKFLDNDNSEYKNVNLVKKDYGHDLALTTTNDEVFVINNIEEVFKLPKYNYVKVNKIGIQSAEIANSHLYLYQDDGTKIDAGFVVGQKGEQGVRGRTGITGETGDRGDRGLKGDRGDTGDRGDKGTRGDVGSQGPEGPQGERGFKGMKGDRGEMGERGEKGPRGVEGPEGDKGVKGEPGKDGDRGIKGNKGEEGPEGSQGIQGIQGPMGIVGAKGERGSEGVQGLMGPRGLTGQQGEKGNVGSQGQVGMKGQKGEIGPIGQQGNKGEVGDRGFQGLKGNQGDKGNKGDVGVMGQKGSLGQKGDTGSVGNIGPQGFQGEKGEKGDRGIYGAYIDTAGYLQIVSGDNKQAKSAGKVIAEKSILHNYQVNFDENVSDVIEVEQSNVLGRLVTTTGYLNNNYNMDTIVPKCCFSTSRKQENIFGIISSINPRYVRNSGLGLVWIVDKNGAVSNGSLIQASEFSGYGEVQDNNVIESCTIAKSLIECEFNITSAQYKCIEITLQGARVKCALIPCLLICG